MTPDQVARVQEAMARLSPGLEDVADDFYARLFDARPDLRAKFPSDIDQQRLKFADELKVIVLAIPDFSRFRARAQELGARHHGYGVNPTDYTPVRTSLLAALAQADPEWDEATEESWRSAYDLVAELMQAGGRAP